MNGANESNNNKFQTIEILNENEIKDKNDFFILQEMKKNNENLFIFLECERRQSWQIECNRYPTCVRVASL